DVYAITEDVAVLDHDVADIDADPEAHAPPFRLGVVRLFKRLLDLDGATDRVEDAGEFGQHAVAGGVCDAAPIPRDELVDERTTGGQRRHRRFLIAMHQAAVALDIGSEDCRKTPLERGSLHCR